MTQLITRSMASRAVLAFIVAPEMGLEAVKFNMKIPIAVMTDFEKPREHASSTQIKALRREFPQ